MSASIAEIKQGLWPPDIDRSKVSFSGVGIVVALSQQLASQHLALPAGTQINSDLRHGINMMVEGQSMHQAKARNREYIADVLAAYAGNLDVRINDLNTQQVMIMAEQEATIMTPVVADVIRTVTGVSGFFNFPIVDGHMQVDDQRIYTLLVPFLYCVFASVLVVDELRAKIKLQPRRAHTQMSLGSGTVDVEQLCESLNGKNILYIREKLGMQLVGDDINVRVDPIGQVITHEGFGATLYADADRSVFLARYLALERALAEGFHEKILPLCQPVSEQAVAATNLAVLRKEVAHENLKAHDHFLEDAACRRTGQLADTIAKEFFAKIADKFERIASISEMTARLHTAITQMIVMHQKETNKPDVKQPGAGVRRPRKQHRAGALMDDTFREAAMQCVENPLVSILGEFPIEFDAKCDQILAAMIIVKGHRHIRTLIKDLRAHLQQLLDEKSPNKLSVEEINACEMLLNLQRVLMLDESYKDPNTVWLLLETIILPSLVAFSEWFAKFSKDYENLAANWQQWKTEMLGIDENDKRIATSAWVKLSAAYENRVPGQNHLVARGNNMYGLANPARRLSFNGRDDAAWNQLKANVIQGLLSGEPFYAGYAVESKSAVDQLIGTFPVYDEVSTMPVMYTSETIAHPERYFDSVQGAYPLRRALYVYAPHERYPSAIISHGLGQGLHYQEVATRRPTGI